MLMSFFRLGSLAALLSEPLVNGFTTGAAVHVTVSQIKDLFGIQIPRHKGAFKIIYVSSSAKYWSQSILILLTFCCVFLFSQQTIIDCIPQIPNANPQTVYMSCSVIFFMVFMNEILKVSTFGLKTVILSHSTNETKTKMKQKMLTGVSKPFFFSAEMFKAL